MSVYLSMDKGEVQTNGILELCFAMSKTVYVPRWDRYEMVRLLRSVKASEVFKFKDEIETGNGEISRHGRLLFTASERMEDP